MADDTDSWQAVSSLPPTNEAELVYAVSKETTAAESDLSDQNIHVVNVTVEQHWQASCKKSR